MKCCNHRNFEAYIDHYMWVRSPNHISKQPHKDGSWVGMQSTHIYWSDMALALINPFLVPSVVFFFMSVFFWQRLYIGLHYQSFLAQWVTTPRLFLCVPLFFSHPFFCKWSHQLLYCALRALLIHCFLTNTKHFRLQKLWLMKQWHWLFSCWSGEEKLDFYDELLKKKANSVHTYWIYYLSLSCRFILTYSLPA